LLFYFCIQISLKLHLVYLLFASIVQDQLNSICINKYRYCKRAHCIFKSSFELITSLNNHPEIENWFIMIDVLFFKPFWKSTLKRHFDHCPFKCARDKSTTHLLWILLHYICEEREKKKLLCSFVLFTRIFGIVSLI
jgi:hypothetical protein